MTTFINTSLSFHLCVSKSPRQNTTYLQKRKTRTKMAGLNFGGLGETRIQVLHVIGQKFTSEWVTHLHILPHNNSRFYASRIHD